MSGNKKNQVGPLIYECDGVYLWNLSTTTCFWELQKFILFEHSEFHYDLKYFVFSLVLILIKKIHNNYFFVFISDWLIDQVVAIW